MALGGVVSECMERMTVLSWGERGFKGAARQPCFGVQSEILRSAGYRFRSSMKMCKDLRTIQHDAV